MTRATRVAAAVVALVPAALLAEAAWRWSTGWRPGGRAETAVLAVVAAGLLFPLLALVPAAARSRALPRLLAAQGAFLLAMLATEGALRVAAPLPDAPSPWPPHVRIETRGEANLRGIHGVKRFSTNARGYRGRDGDPADALRLVAVGGSTTECLYLDDGEAWPELLRGEMERRLGRRAWMGNAGRAALNTWDHLVHIERLPEVGSADAVIVLCGINDVFRHLGGTWRLARGDAARRALYFPLPGPDAPLAVRSQALARLRAAARNLVARGDRDRTAVQDVEGRWVAERRALRFPFPKRDDLPDLGPALDAYAGMVRRMVEAARGRGARILLLSQPTLYGPTVDPGTEPLLYGSVRKEEGFAWSTPALHRAMAAFNGTMARVAEETGTPCVRLDLLLPREGGFLYDDCHFNEAGSRRVAEIVAPALEELLRAGSAAGKDGGPPADGGGDAGRGDGR